MNKLGLVPLSNFAQVLPDIYRCAQPIYKYQYDWLRDVLGIKMIVDLRKESDIDVNYFDSVIRISVPDHEVPTMKQAQEFMQLVKKNKQPMLIHCAHGHGRTSTFCVLARIAVGWSVERAISNERIKFHYQFNHPAQEKWLMDNFGKEAGNAN
jgi:protein tyrosine/serine phosphatase